MVSKGSKYCRCLYFSANTLARVITRLAEEAFAPTGMSPSYGFILMSVHDEPGIQPLALARQMELAPSTVTRLVEKLEARGWVERRQSGKETFIHPLPASEALVGEVRKCWKALYRRYADILGEEAARELTQDIHQAAAALEPEARHEV